MSPSKKERENKKAQQHPLENEERLFPLFGKKKRTLFLQQQTTTGPLPFIFFYE